MVRARAFDKPTELEQAILDAACRPARDSGLPPDFARRPPLVKHIRDEVARRRGLGDLPMQTLKGHLTKLFKRYGVADAPAGTKLSQLVRVAYELELIEGWGPERAPSGSILVRRRCFGRERELDQLVSAIGVDSPDPVPITGAAGIGKSTLASALSHDSRIVARFKRRYNVACTGVATAAALTNAIAAAIGDEVGPRPAQVLSALPNAFLILDGLEVPWRQDPHDVEHLLCALAGVDGLALICCVRGDALPARVPWGSETRVGQLDAVAAAELFGDRAGRDRSQERRFDDLIEAMEGHPFGLELLGSLARHEPSLERLHARWRRDGPTLLPSLVALLREAVLAMHVTDDARRLLALAASLPGGIAHDDVERLLPGGDVAAADLRAAALVTDEHGRLQLHSLVREYVLGERSIRVWPEDRERADAHFLDLARHHGPHVELPDGLSHTRRLLDEFANIAPAIRRALARGLPTGIEAALALKHFSWFTGMSIAELLEDAARAARDAPERIDALNAMGLSALACSDHDAARTLFERAYGLCDEVDDAERRATCVLNLAEVALRVFDHDLARDEFERARTIYRRARQTLGEANCLLGLGQIDLRRSRPGSAERRFEVAGALYAEVGDLLGTANCVKGLGDVAWLRSDVDGALDQLADALTRYRAVHHVLGEANCLRDVGELALVLAARDEDEPLVVDAADLLADARALFESIENPLGQANCLAGRAEIDLARGDADAAFACLRAARRLYRRVGCSAGAVHCDSRLRALSRAGTAGEAIESLVPRTWIPDDNA